MKIQPKSLVSALTGRGRTQAESAEAALKRSLAPELHESALEGFFQYPRRRVLITRVLAITIAVVALARVLIVLLNALRAPDGFLPNFLRWEIIGTVVGASIALFASALLANLFQTLRITPLGLGISELTGWRRVSWEQLGKLRVMELSSTGRYVVMIPINGPTHPATPAPMLRIVPALSGASRTSERGLIITSEMGNFDRLLQLLVAYISQAAGKNVPMVEEHIEEDAVMPVAQLALEPQGALARMAQHEGALVDEYGVSIRREAPIRWDSLLKRQLPIALAPALFLLADVLMRHAERPPSWTHLLWAVVLVAFGMAELPFIAKLTQTVGDLMIGGGQFTRPAWAYLEMQVPRAVMIVVGAAMLGIGLPSSIAQACWLVGIVLTTLLLTRFVEKLYYIPIGRSLLATIGAAIFQVFVLGIYFIAR